MARQPPAPADGFGATTAISLVVANMIGTGVFTSLGFQLEGIRSPIVLIGLWVIGGLIALCGALTYAELGAALPRSGGEYNFLSRIYHPAAGFVSGWISATIGFAAPTALVAITFGTYLAAVLPALPPVLSATVLVVVLSLLHALSRRSSARLQQLATAAKVLLIVAFCALALWLTDAPQRLHWTPASTDLSLLAGPGFAVALIYVNYAYTGWNAATYLSSELVAPQRDIPRVLFGGTVVVMVLYVLLNYVFLRTAPMDAMAGQLEIGYVVAGYAFGPAGAQIMGVVLALLLISTASAMILAGPRVLQTIGQDFAPLRVLALANRNGVPAVAIGVQAGMSLLLIWTATFESILLFTGFTLALNTFAAVLGVFVLRHREPDLERPYRVTLWPLPPLVFLALTGWTLVYLIRERPLEGLTGLGLVAGGLVFYAFARRQ